ncbi:S1C family serine protease [Brucepastera parasyntrophica]|uniref:S1C family serine protease n=1 Tax=Brucepastera parasyntrophica TaxID=2880008 RepID=UPI00210D2232|nr:S1C family serine protease [Brucepastera parasyntrophica]ULQ60480.1 S1C family serine protease [Brucepastera parasyntrophica]
MLKGKKKVFFIILGISCFLAVFLSGCKTTKEVETVVDYSDERSLLYAIDQVKKIMEKDPVRALWRARILFDNATNNRHMVESLYSDAAIRTADEFKTMISAEKWNDALRIYRSLSVLSMAPGDWSEEKIIETRLRTWEEEGKTTLANLGTVQKSTPEDEAPSPRIVANMIQGTVTVWVDRGVRVQSGVGYADRVIGSGFFIDKSGYIVTNYHVIASEVDPKYEGYSRLYIKLASDSDTRIPARVIGWDPVFDLALLKTEIEPSVVFQLGSSESLVVGTRIYAIGSPAGLEQTLTSGIVSAQKRRLISLGDILQIDAPINQGNSGGPIVDEAGRVQAIVFAGIESFEGLNFAIPVEYLKIILPDLYAGGEVSHPWVGAYGKTVALPGSSAPAGVGLFYAVPGEPSSVSGIPENAVITSMNGIQVNTLEDLQYQLIRQIPGSIVRLSGIAGESESGEPQTRDWYVYLSNRPEVPGKLIFDRDIKSRALYPFFGMKLEKVGRFNKYVVTQIIKGA